MVEQGNSVGRPRVDPVQLRLLAGVVVLVEAACILVVVVLATFDAFSRGNRDIPASVANTLLLVLTGLGVGLCGWGVIHGRRWSRAPVLTWQLIQLLIAAPAVGHGDWFMGPFVLFSLIAGGVALRRSLFQEDGVVDDDENEDEPDGDAQVEESPYGPSPRRALARPVDPDAVIRREDLGNR